MPIPGETLFRALARPGPATDAARRLIPRNCRHLARISPDRPRSAPAVPLLAKLRYQVVQVIPSPHRKHGIPTPAGSSRPFIACRSLNAARTGHHQKRTNADTPAGGSPKANASRFRQANPVRFLRRNLSSYSFIYRGSLNPRSPTANACANPRPLCRGRSRTSLTPAASAPQPRSGPKLLRPRLRASDSP